MSRHISHMEASMQGWGYDNGTIPSSNDLQVGCLQRIAAALESIERHLFELTPKGVEDRKRRQKERNEENATREQRDRVEQAIMRLNPDIPDGLQTYRMAIAFTEICGTSADPTDAQNWILTAKKAHRRVRCFGVVTTQKLMEWTRAAFPNAQAEVTS